MPCGLRNFESKLTLSNNMYLMSLKATFLLHFICMLPKWSPLIVIVDCPIFRFRPNHGKNENEREIENPNRPAEFSEPKLAPRKVSA